jgi:carbon-monoxide dehydrogenase medium subunit
VPLAAAYHRPQTLAEALTLLAEPQRIPLAGGTIVNGDRARTGAEVVDLQALGLSGIETAPGGGSRLRIGATTTLSALAASEGVPDWLRTIAAAEAPSTLRTLATVGGAAASASTAGLFQSLLVAALLACDPTAEIAGPDGTTPYPFADLIADGVPPGSLLTGITIDPSGSGAHAVTARTPADTPIVGAAVRVAPDGIEALAFTGVASTPILLWMGTAAESPTPADAIAVLQPPSDFRGSSEYRRSLAATLSARALAAAREGASA